MLDRLHALNTICSWHTCEYSSFFEPNALLWICK